MTPRTQIALMYGGSWLLLAALVLGYAWLSKRLGKRKPK